MQQLIFSSLVVLALTAYGVYHGLLDDPKRSFNFRYLLGLWESQAVWVKFLTACFFIVFSPILMLVMILEKIKNRNT